MSILTIPKDVFFFVSVLYNRSFSNENIENILNKKFGPFYILNSDFYPMKDYYAKEMGDKNTLGRLVFLFPTLSNRENLIQFKLWADQLEKETSTDNKRQINVDVGYLSLENVVLATGKQFSHRIYLSNGVYADLNLVFEKNTFYPTAWAYPDYSHIDFINFFNWGRSILLGKLNNS